MSVAASLPAALTSGSCPNLGYEGHTRWLASRDSVTGAEHRGERTKRPATVARRRLASHRARFPAGVLLRSRAIARHRKLPPAAVARMPSFCNSFLNALKGFPIEGIVRTERLVRCPACPGIRLIASQSDDAIAVIDDPYDLDPTGLGAPFVNVSDFSRLSRIHDAAGTAVVDVWDGAALVLKDVTVPAGGVLRFEYSFVGSANPNSGGPELDVAVLELEPTSGRRVSQAFADTAVLRNQNQLHTGWRPFSRRFPKGFSGTIRWICANGAIANPAAPQRSEDVVPRHPSVLLLDFVEIA